MPLLNMIWSIFVFFLLVAWIWVIIGVIGDVFRSKDLSGMAKGIWVLFIMVIPWFGVLCYLVVRGKGMEERGIQVLKHADDVQRAYIQNVAGSSAADELSKLAALKDKGVISDAEFEGQKTKLLG